MPDALNEWFAAHPRFPEMAEELSRLARDPKWRRMVDLEERFVGVVGALRADAELPYTWMQLEPEERLKRNLLLSAEEHDELDALGSLYPAGRFIRRADGPLCGRVAPGVVRLTRPR
jgi:hypothetical protein